MSPGASSNRIKEKKESILSLWEERCIKEVPSAGTAVSLALRDSVPIYLDHLSEALATNRKMDFRSVSAHDKESTRIGKMHGADRASNRSYILTEVIFEYHILREVIFQVLETGGPLADVQRNIILDSIEESVNDAAVEFSEVHADIQQKFINTLTHDLKNPITAAKTNAELTVHNEGEPISADEMPLLFQQYRRSKSAQESTKTGWGLGLTLVKGVVSAHQGKIRVESAEGQGTSFILEIPYGEMQVSDHPIR